MASRSALTNQLLGENEPIPDLLVKHCWPEPVPSFLRVFVPILYRRTGRGGVFGFIAIVFSVTYSEPTSVERTIPSLATIISVTWPKHPEILHPFSTHDWVLVGWFRCVENVFAENKIDYLTLRGSQFC